MGGAGAAAAGDAVRHAAGRPAGTALAVHESAEGVVPAATSGFDHHKKINGHKRHLLVDTMGLLIAVAVTLASAQDRAGAARRRCARDYERLSSAR